MLIFDRNKLSKEIATLTEQRDRLLNELNLAKNELDKTNCEIAQANNELANVINAKNAIEVYDEYGVPYYEESLDETENRLYELQNKLNAIVAGTWTEGMNNQWQNTGLWRIERKYTVDGSIIKGNELQKAIGSGLCYMLNSYIANKEKSLTCANLEKNKDLIISKFNAAQKKANKVGLSLSSAYVKCRLEMMDVKLAIKVKKDEERKRLREEKKRLREQEKLLEEIAVAEKKLEIERKAMNLAFAQALTDQEREDIKSRLAEIDKRMDDLSYRKEHNKAGWLYVIASDSLPGLVKIGVTRRLNPTIRVKELSSSSLPTPFHSYGFVFNDDCFALESEIHQYFNDKRVSPDREFFYITPKDAIDVLKNKFNQEVHFESEEDEDNE